MKSRSIAVLGIGFFASFLVYAGAFGPYLTWPGEGPVGRFVKLFLLPIAATAILALVNSLQRRRAGQPVCETADRAVDGIVFSIVLFLIAVHGLLLGVLLRVEWISSAVASRAVVVGVGLTLVAIGNLLPRTRPNLAVGIRTARTMADRQLWILTHRVSGYVAVTTGVATVFAGALLSGPNIPRVAVSAFLTGLAWLCVRYWRYSRVPNDTRHA